MMRFRVKKWKKISIPWVLNLMTALFLILNCQSVWQRAYSSNFHIYECCCFIILLNTIYNIGHWGLPKSSQNRFLLLTGIYLFVIFFVIIFSVNSSNMIRFLSRFLIYPVFLLFFSSSAPIKHKLGIFKCFIDWMAVISWTTFLIWVGSSIGILKPSGSFEIDWGGKIVLFNYHNLYYSSPQQYVDWIGQGVRRNIGIFVEGPMFMLTLILALLFCFITEKEYQIKKWKIVGIILALISTASITGYTFLIIIIGIRLVQNNKKIENRIIIGLMAGVFSFIGIYFFLKMKSDTASFLIRVDDYLTGLKAWRSSPLIGIGYENDVVLKSFMSASRLFNTGFSNTIFSILAYGGLIFIIPFTIPVIRGIYLSSKRKNSQILLISLVFLGLYFTVIFYTCYVIYLMWAFLMLIYTDCFEKEESLYSKKC